MHSVVTVFLLEWRRLFRSWTVPLMLAFSVGWTVAIPYLLTGDGTADGLREMAIRFSLGGAATVVAVSLLAMSAGSLSADRTAHRLEQSLVRPVSRFSLAFGRVLALSTVGALVIGASFAVEAFRCDAGRTCVSVWRPIMPSPEAEAATMYDAYVADPGTPAAIRKAPRSVVMRLLANRAFDRYQTVETNATATWKFNRDLLSQSDDGQTVVRLKFTNLYELRDSVRGVIELNGSGAIVSNMTQSTVCIPLKVGLGEDDLLLAFRNCGKRSVMLRPRRDIEVLMPADGYGANLLRAYCEVVSMLTLLVAFGVFLGAGLGRPVAVFVAVVVLAVCEMSPSVIEQYPDSLETNRVEAFGLTLTRLSAAVTHPIGSLSPLSTLAVDEQIPTREVVRTVCVDLLTLPVVLSLLAAFVMPRKRG